MFTLILDKKDKMVTMIDSHQNLHSCNATWAESKNQIILQIDPLTESPVEPKPKIKRVRFSGEMVDLSPPVLQDLIDYRDQIIYELGVNPKTVDNWIATKRCSTGLLVKLGEMIANPQRPLPFVRG